MVYGGIKLDKLGLNDIRERYLTFFEKKDHLRIASYPLIPQNDNSLLLINSGMAPLKPYFTGAELPPKKRVATCQKCIRTGDIENVGKTARHLTFFEMLGNFSFGDYFKNESIPWAWEFCTKELAIPAEKLYISIYLDDDEAFEIWNKKVGIAAEKIFRMGKEDNFWEHGFGPCGPCSEIYFDRGSSFGKDDFMASVTEGEDRFIEVWNLVFTQFDKQESGEYLSLESPNIDTGMGLERMAMVMQGVGSVYEVDTIKQIRDKVCELSQKSYGNNNLADISIRLITDHVRSISFMIADGIMPSNEGRGYVLRRLLRRCARHGKTLGIKGLFINKIISVVISNYNKAYTELKEKQDYIFKLVNLEEERFYETLDAGIEILKGLINKTKLEGNDTLPGEDAFKLYDTYGFPLELTKDILSENGLTLDEVTFEARMQNQRIRAREAHAFSGGFNNNIIASSGIKATEFLGYDSLNLKDSDILGIILHEDFIQKAEENCEVSIILDKTTVYCNMGGQKADKATIATSTGTVEVSDCIKESGCFVHICKVTKGYVEKGQKATVKVDPEHRIATARNHTATHLLHMALRDVLGSHVQQAGSSKDNTRLRFDFSHFAPITSDELYKIENIVNNAILRSLPVEIKETDIAEAKAMGAIALFGEKYGDIVRVVDIGGESIELCGGTHIKNSSGVGSFKIISEGGIAQGVRRIEAITGACVIEHNRTKESQLQELGFLLKTPTDRIKQRTVQLLDELDTMQKELGKLKQSATASQADEILANKIQIQNIDIAYSIIQNVDTNNLRSLGDTIKSKLDTGIVLLIGVSHSKGSMLIMATDGAVNRGINCGNIIKLAAKAAGGTGGGRANMAQAGIKDISLVKNVMDTAINTIRDIQ